MGEKYQSVYLEKLKPILETCVHCYCGLCVEGCPVYRATLNEAYAARGLNQVALALLEGQLSIAELSDLFVYSCCGCRYCEWDCSLNKPRYIAEYGNRLNKVSGATVAEIIRAIKVETGNIPIQIKNALANIAKYGNPYGLNKVKKDEWVDKLGLRLHRGQDTILYAGPLVPFENRSTDSANALIEILRRVGIDFGLIGGEELDSGYFARVLGEEGLFEEIVKHNLKLFKE